MIGLPIIVFPMNPKKAVRRKNNSTPKPGMGSLILRDSKRDFMGRMLSAISNPFNIKNTMIERGTV